MEKLSVYPTSEACAIARIDNKRFNEAAAREFYPCAPTARRGSARRFSENDVVALFVYARLVEQNIPQRQAGQMACQVRSKIEEDPKAEEVRVLGFEEHSKEKLGSEQEGHDAETSVYMHHYFDVGGIRQYIRAASEALQTKEGQNERY